MLKKTVLLAAVTVTLSAAAAGALSKTDQPAKTVFHGVGPAGFKIEGKTNALDVKEDAKT